MAEPLAYLNGQFVPASHATVPLYDSGFVLGATVTEQLRTFQGQLFRLDQHLARLARSLEIVGVQPGMSQAEFRSVAEDLATQNHTLLAQGDDLGLAILVTPGPYATLASDQPRGPTVCLHTYPLPFQQWVNRYEAGDAVATPQILQVSARSWPRELKCRSRMHYYLADRQARTIDPASRALLLDEDGFVTEATTANLVIHTNTDGLLSPRRAKILPGISLSVVAELAGQLGIRIADRDLLPGEVAVADEVMLTGTTSCLLPVVRFNNSPVGTGTPGPVFQQLLSAWSQLVNVDIVAQAQRFSLR